MASKLHNTEVEVKITETKENCDHVQFLISEKGGGGRVAPELIEEDHTLSQGGYTIIS